MEKLVNQIYYTISEFLPKKFNNAYFYAQVSSNNSVSLKFFVKEKHKIIDCYQLENVNRNNLILTLGKLSKEILNFRKNSESKSDWTLLTIIFEKDLSFNLYFDYDNYDEKLISFELDWKKKYLK